MRQWKIGILLFNEVEVLDFAGPFEVFSITNYPESNVKPFEVKTVAQTKETVRARNGLKVVPDYCFADNPNFDILVIPGGYGAEEIEIHNDDVVGWIKDQMNKVTLMTSVCTGAFLLAKAGLLDGKKATTHWMDIDRLEREFEKVEVERGVKYVDEGSIITAGGISAGINMSFFMILKLLGEEIARTTAKRMEYDICF
ncbi:transcriptional regulator containing an amidase domain and an AraC-type DNA-binding HTH domain [Desulfosporosinus orientis DSM 765]|uniref:Transcriptional regulator containing an amidase domain and an AraC-type DNA-binding HTH domain n=1 Tax=Desulfosporosinus orientis (strain ATCC 19365 / DSM 765 / NCIMB 8382 / VKM B-1628 / Singapore I) TaxID=768706 RepID=G7WB50_DESOD|nr:DJ-1/PfpI family protein [Desulfosporosinus orientis]AET67831.1 transcriptional regulator containing an amidase domain and an AraC-type DNA-binding HTH domain [Desulfosporosinus orientis DSM 765]